MKRLAFDEVTYASILNRKCHEHYFLVGHCRFPSARRMSLLLLEDRRPEAQRRRIVSHHRLHILRKTNCGLSLDV